ncbi:MAG: dipeptidase [Rhodobacteraceae bacterium]|nr:dipeptidase [Paracoccaceae bacterium]
MIVDALQYAEWSERVFRQMREGDVSAVHATIAYHETFRETVDELIAWNRRFEAHAELITWAGDVAAIRQANDNGRTAILFGLQNPSPIEGDIGLLEILHRLGVRFMQIAYNTQSLLAAGWTELEDGGVTRFGREAIAEMNRLGMAIDLSHAADRSARDAIAFSSRPVALTHANPRWARETGRNPPDEVIAALVERGGVMGFSLYPHHLPDGSETTLEGFCTMVARAVEQHGVGAFGLGSDLCQDRSDETVAWMRTGRWTKAPAGPDAVFPKQPDWFRGNGDFPGIADGLARIGFANNEVSALMGGNWMRFFEEAFQPVGDAP